MGENNKWQDGKEEEKQEEEQGVDSIRAVGVPGCGKGISVVAKIPHSPPESVPL